MRAANRLGGLLLGLVLLAGGLLVAADAILAVAGRVPWPVRVDRWYATLTGTPLHDPAVLAIAIAVAVVGLALLVAQLRPWAPRELRVSPGAGDTELWLVQRRSVERRIAEAADELTGVEGTRARLRGRGERWRLRVRAIGRPDTRATVEERVRGELARLSTPDTLRLRLSLRGPKRVT